MIPALLLVGFVPSLHGQTLSPASPTSSLTPEITFEGNVKVSSQELLDNFKDCAKEYWETYDQRVYKYFSQKCTRRLLWSRGFLRATIVEQGTRFDGDRYKVRFVVTEGSLYRWGKFTVEGNSVFSTHAILKSFGQKTGDIANGTALEDFIYYKLRDEYSERGYVNYIAEFDPVFHEVANGGIDGRVDATIAIEEGKKFVVRRIFFTGIEDADARILKRDFLLKERDVFVKSKFELAIRKINETQLFYPIDKDQDVEIRLDEESGDLDLAVKIKKVQ